MGLSNTDYDGNKKYEVFVIDYWSNIYEAYFVDSLEDAEECLNAFFESVDCVVDPECDEEHGGKVPHFGSADTDYKLYVEDGTFGQGIGTINITCEDGDYQVRGFVLR